jgi:hypothetical protein
MKKQKIKDAADEYWENVYPDVEVGVKVEQLVKDAYISGVRMAKSYMVSLLMWRDDFLFEGDDK